MSDHKLSTRAIHPARKPRQKAKSIAPDLVLSASFAYDRVEDLNHACNIHDDHVYSRLTNPTLDELEGVVADLEGGDAAISFASGMGAINGVLASLLSAGSHMILPRSVYGGTFALTNHVLNRFGVSSTVVDYRDREALLRACRPETKVIWAETIANPTLDIADLPTLSELAHAQGALLVVDSTFASPALCRPLEHGADVIVHSASKYLGGHGDLIGGVAVASKALIETMFSTVIEMGGRMSPFVAWLVLRGVKTLELRVKRSGESARRIARFLAAHRGVNHVIYPGLASHPDHDRARKMFDNGFGGVVSIDLVDGESAARFMNKLQLFLLAPSLGDTHSLALIPAATSHRQIAPAERAAAGITDGLVRLSIGLEDPDDLIRDLGQALRAS